MTIESEMVIAAPEAYHAEWERQRTRGAQADVRQCWLAAVRSVVRLYEESVAHEPIPLRRVK